MKRENLQLAGIILLAFFVRTYNLGTTFLHTDEAKTALGVDFPHSFVLPYLAHFSQIVFGVNNFAVRLPFALLGVLSVLVFYHIGKVMHGDKGALLYAFLATFLPVNVLLSRTAFLDIALLAVWTLIVLFWIKYENDKSDKNLFLIFLFLAISLWFKIQAVYLFVALFLYLLVVTRGRFWQDQRFYLLGLSVIPFGFYFLSQPQQIYDMMHYTSDEVGSSFSDIGKMSVLLMKSYGILLLFVLAGLLELIKKKDFYINKKINLFFLIFSVLILAVLLTTPKRIYYYVMLDISVVYFSAYFFLATAKRKWLSIFLMLVVLINFSYLILRMNGEMYPQQEEIGYSLCDKMNSLIKNTPDPKSVYWDTSFGFTYKWCTDYPVKKLDNLLEKEINDNTNILVILDPITFENNQQKFSGFKVEDFRGKKVLTRTQSYGNE